MNATEAREHLVLAQSILARVPRLARPSGTLLVAWGLVAAFQDVIIKLVDEGKLPPISLVACGVAALAAIALTVVLVRDMRRSGNAAWVDVQLGRLFGAGAVAMMFGCGGVGAFSPTWVTSSLANVVYGTIILFVGFCGDRAALAAGLLLLAAVPIAALTGVHAGYVLAASFLIGYVGLGFYYRLAHVDG